MVNARLNAQLEELARQDLFRTRRVLEGPQGVHVSVGGRACLSFCSNDYLGLANHPRINAAVIEAVKRFGVGAGASPLVTGHNVLHQRAEENLAAFVGLPRALLFSSGYQANIGAITSLVGRGDAVFSDALNHASIIDGIRLCKAQRYRYQHSDMQDLEEQLKLAQAQRFRIIVTDGVFSMDGDIAKMDKICDLADKYDALVMTDECHSAGFIGKTGRGVPEHCGVMDRVDIITGTLGKALGGAMGGYTTGKKEIIEMLRQRSRPYLFSNSLAPSIVGASIKVFEILSSTTVLRDKLEKNTLYFKEKIRSAGFDIKPGDSPIVPIMLYDAALSQKFAELLLKEGVYAVGFFFPVVAKGQARIRTQISAAHSISDLDKAIAAFIKVGKELNVI